MDRLLRRRPTKAICIFRSPRALQQRRRHLHRRLPLAPPGGRPGSGIEHVLQALVDLAAGRRLGVRPRRRWSCARRPSSSRMDVGAGLRLHRAHGCSSVSSSANSSGTPPPAGVGDERLQQVVGSGGAAASTRPPGSTPAPARAWPHGRRRWGSGAGAARPGPPWARGRAGRARRRRGAPRPWPGGLAAGVLPPPVRPRAGPPCAGAGFFSSLSFCGWR